MTTGKQNNKNKLKIIKGKLEGNKVVFNDKESESVINITFNPTEYSIKKNNTFSEATIPGLGSPIIQFSSGKSKTLSLELLLDTYTYDKGVDIREKYIDKLEKLIEIDGSLHAPPPCQVRWSSLIFVGVLESISKNYVLFKNDGTPVRARVSLSFKEYIAVEIQVKKNRNSSPDKYKRRIIIEGDSLWFMSYKEYGSPDCWRLIAEENNIDNPLQVEAGQELLIPPL